MDVKTALALLRENINAMTLEKLQRHKARLVSASYEAAAEYGFEQAVRDGFYLPIASESATGFTPRHLYLQQNLQFSLSQTDAREKALLSELEKPQDSRNNPVKGSQEAMRPSSEITVLSKYGPDDYSFWMFYYREDAPIQMDLSRPAKGTLEDVFGRIEENEEWVLLRGKDRFTAYPVQNQEILAERYITDGYSERGNLAQLCAALNEDFEVCGEATEEKAEEDNEM